MDEGGCEVKIWVTGARGVLGSSLVRACRKQGLEVIATGREEADICNLDSLKAKALELRPTHIVNCSAFTDVDGAEADPSATFAVNVDGAANIACVAKESEARLVHISTDYVFNGRGHQPYREEDLCGPVNIYGKSKWEGEKRVAAINPSACILRTSWLFGVRGKNLISSLLWQLQQKEELQVVFDQCGKPTYCADLAEAVIALLDFEGIVHFANEGASSRYQIALDLLEAVKARGVSLKCQSILPVLSSQFPTLAPRPCYSVLSTDKYCHYTSTKPRLWSEAVNEFFDDALGL
jgi:dTDP-4-dehydrorhamnose reductase